MQCCDVDSERFKSGCGREQERRRLTLFIQLGVGVIDKASTFILVNINDFCSISSSVASTSWLHKHVSFLDDDCKLSLRECTRPFGITTSGFTPGGVTEARLPHGLLAGGEVKGSRKGYCLASGGLGHRDRQCTSRNQSQCPFHLTMVRTISRGQHIILTDALARPRPPVAAGVSLSGPWRPGIFLAPSVAVRCAANVWRTNGLRKSPFHFCKVSFYYVQGSVLTYIPFCLHCPSPCTRNEDLRGNT